MTASKTIGTRGGLQLPAFGLGTWRMGEDPASRGAEVAALKLGLDLGATMIDTAEMYGGGGAERIVAEAVAGRRDGLTIVSKVLPQNASRAGTIEAAERSLHNLGTECIDLYLLHWSGSYALAETYEAFERLVEQGKILHYGVSNFDAREMAASESTKGGGGVQADQVLYNLERRGIEYRLLPWCREQGIAVMAYSPLEQARLQPGGALQRVARRHGCTPYQAALAWTVREPGVSTIPKATSPAHVRANLAALDIELAADDLADLDGDHPPPERDGPLDVL